VAIVTTSGTVGLFQQFTGERAVLERAINRLSVQTREATSRHDSPRITDYQAELIDLGDREALELAALELAAAEGRPLGPPGSSGAGGAGGGRGGQGGQQGGMTPREMLENQVRSIARMIVNQNAAYTRTTLDTLENVIRNLRGLPGRKMLVLLSDGFYLGGKSASQIFDMRRITDAATRAGVVIYSIDTRGLVATPPGGDASQPSGLTTGQLPGAQSRIEQGALQAKRDGLNALASDTGGFLVLNTNDLNLGLQRVLDDNETYYVLAYEPPESRRDGRFHKIEVRIADRPELKARTRKGYFAPLVKPAKADEKQKEKSPEKIAREAEATKVAQIRSSLASLFPLRDIPIELSADFVDTQERGPTVLVNAFVDASALDLQQKGDLHQDSLDVVVAIYDEKGKIAHTYGDRLDINLKSSNLEVALKHGFSYRSTVALKPGFYQARIGVREQGTARLGSATSWVEVPDLSKKNFSLSSIILSIGDERQTSQNPSAREEGYKLRPSTARRRFKSGSKLDFLIFAYNARAEKGSADVVIQSQVYSGSKLVYASPLAKMPLPENSDLRRIPYAAQISLEGFDPGQYELRLMAVDRTTKATAHQRLNFMVEAK
jgi:VWFA-related protein